MMSSRSFGALLLLAAICFLRRRRALASSDLLRAPLNDAINSSPPPDARRPESPVTPGAWLANGERAGGVGAILRERLPAKEYQQVPALRLRVRPAAKSAASCHCCRR